MAKSRIGFTLLAVVMLWSGAGLVQADPPPTPAQMIQAFKPRQPGIAVGTPSDAELQGCKVELVKGQKLANGKAGSGWLLRDPQGRVVRRFFDSDGDKQIDVWSYFLNGEECYREIDSNLNGKADQYRWLGANGSKWGVDLNEDGVIDSWKMISPEEVSQEVLAAIMAKDLNRLQALMLTKAEMDSLELPDSEANRIKTKMKSVASTFQTTVAALAKLSDKTKWVHLEISAPECIPADALGGKVDLIHHKHGTILYSDGDKVNDFVQTGEMILVGRAWRLIEAPIPGGTSTQQATGGSSGGVEIEEGVKALLDRLKLIDEKYVGASTPEKVGEYNMARAVVLEEIVTASKAKNREEWIKQLADCYSTAAQNNDPKALQKLASWSSTLAKEAPGSNVAAYVVYREMSGEYAMKLTKTPANLMSKLQEEWRDRLTKFVQEFPTAEDTPDAMMQLGMVAEFNGKETEAKNWYDSLVKNFDKNPLVPKATGAIRRLGLDGQEFELTSATLGQKAPFDVKSLKGKIVVVYYWASWNSQSVADFAKIKAVAGANVAKGVEVVCVNLDTNEAEAIKFLQANPLPGTHVFQTGGLESAPAVNYGIMVLPNMFIVGTDGKVVSRNAQVATLDDEIKKLVK